MCLCIGRCLHRGTGVEVRGAEGVVAMGVVMGVEGVFLVVMAEAMGVGVVMGVEQPYVLLTRSHCNRCPECRLSTPNQGRRPHRRRC